MDLMEIIPLHRIPDYAPILAHWSYMEWYRARSMDFTLVLRAYQERARSDRVPLSFVAIEGSLPVGMVTLKLDDLWSRKDLNPWLASLYVLPEYRRCGTGQALVRAVTARAPELGHDRLYLFLGRHDREWLERYYINRGWAVVESAVDNDGLETKILAYELPR
ncbi:MAG: GNAT family N-acetyltransferase [Spirochaetes bacterium]|nr:GNAT family N-acetyltransferase [Spirochaetota bacterium]